MSELLSTALEYAARGWAVFPCRWHGKKPATFKGFQNATKDPDIIRGWWTGKSTQNITGQWRRKDGDYNIGVATGAASGFIVVDLDGEAGLKTWAKLQEENGVVETRMARTGSGGFHVLFTHPELEIGNRAGVLEGIDFRGDGGYIVAAPSIHPDGPAYEWVNPEAEIAPPPMWVLNWLMGKKDPETESTDVIEAASTAYTFPTAVSQSRYVEAALLGEASRVQSAREGTRNDTLNRAAFNLGQIVTTGALSESTVVEVLTRAATAAGLEAEEIAATIKSGISGGMAKPRTVRTTPVRPVGRVSLPQGADEPTVDGVEPPEEAPIAVPDWPRGPVGDPLLTLPATDAGNAEAFAHLHGHRFRYDVTREKWLNWDGNIWALDITGAHVRKMLETMRARRDAANSAASMATTDAERERARKLINFSLMSENTAKIAAAIKAAQVLEGLATTIDLFDADHFKITAGARTINLATGEDYPPRWEDFISMRCGAAYDPKAEAPRWISFLHEVWPKNPEVVEYIQRVAGYALTGSMKEHAFFLLVGGGRNGKSTLLNVLRAALGDYAGVSAFATFDADKGNDTSNDLAGLRGRRLVTVSETDEDKRLAEARVKGVTGGDPIQCRFLFREFFTYSPTWKVVMAVNHLPSISGTDDGIWSRIHLIRFEESFLGREDKDLERTLRGELPGVLNWAIEGARAWRTVGLCPPDFVKSSTGAYRADSDILGQWMEERVKQDPTGRLLASVAYPDYTIWAKNMGIKVPLSRKKWGNQLAMKGLIKAHGASGDYFSGISLK